MIPGNGYVRAEACVVTLLQKVSNAKRVYATVINTGTNTDGNKEQGITFPSGKVQKDLILSVFEKAGMNPAEVVYIEAHGTGTKVSNMSFKSCSLFLHFYNIYNLQMNIFYFR